MRTIVIFSLCFVLEFSSLFAQSSPVEITPITDGFTVTFTLPAYTLRDTTLTEFFNTNEIFKYVKLDDFGIIYDIGYPMLPQYSFDLHVPYDASDFAVACSLQTTQTVGLNRRILPLQEDFCKDNLSPNTFELNSAYYASNGSLYNFTSQLSDPYIVLGEQGITLSIFPFLYNPQVNSLTVIQQATFTVLYSMPRSGSRSTRALTDSISQARQEYLSAFFANYTPTRSGTSFGGRYLMITTPNLEATLAPFANYKRALGYEVAVYAISSSYSVTDIKNLIKLYYQFWNVDFVLLVGDHNVIPAAAGNPSGEVKTDPITDLHYACLHDDDLIAAVHLGRFPVANDISGAAALKQIITKVMEMESNIHHFTKNAVFVAGQESDRKLEKQLEEGINYLADKIFKQSEGYNSQKLFQPDDTQVRNAINNNPLFFMYSGHGSISSMAGSSFTVNSTFLNTNCTNTVFPFVFSFACKTGNFANNTCIGTNWLARDNGGVSYFGSSVNTYFDSDVKFTKSVFNKDANRLFTSTERLGTFIDLGKKRYKNDYWGIFSGEAKKYIRQYLKAYNLLGDPSLNIHGNGWNITGTSTVVCTTGSVFNLVIPSNFALPQNTITWEIDAPFTAVQDANNQTKVTVTKTGVGTNTAMLRAKFGGVVTAEQAIIPCGSSISGSNIACYDGEQYSVNTPSNITIYWTVSNPSLFTVNSSGNPTTVTRIGSGTGSAVLTAYTGNAGGAGSTQIATKTISPCQLSISGSNTVCYGGNQFTLNYPPPQGTTLYYWTVTGPFSFSSSSPDPSTSVYPPKVYKTTGSGSTGTLSVRIGGVNGTIVASTILSTCVTSISGPVLCYNSGSFSISNPPSGTIYWTVDNNSYIVTSSGNPTTVTYTGPYIGTTILSARTGSTSGTVVATKYIDACNPVIDGSSTVCYSGNQFTLLNAPPSQTIYWSVDDPTIFNVNPSGNPTIVYRIGTGSSNVKLRARTGSTSGPLITDLVLTPCASGPSIYGYSKICNSGSAVFSISTGASATWSVTSGFSLSTNSGTSITVTATTANQSGTLTAVVNGVTYYKSIQSLPIPSCNLPSTDFVYMTSLPCGAAVDLIPYHSMDDPTAIYKWDVIYEDNCTYSVSSGSDGSSNHVQFGSNASGTLRIDAYLKISPNDYSPHPTVEYRIGSSCRSGSSSSLKAYPNPVFDILTVDINTLIHLSSTLSSSRSSPTFDIRLYDGQGNLLRQQKAQGGTVQFNVANLLNGIYYLHIYDGVSSTPEMLQIVVEH